MTQTETIVWHEFEDEKPISDGFYLVHYIYEAIVGDGIIGEREDIGKCLFHPEFGWYWEEEDIPITDPETDFIAWAEMPNGWRND